MQNYDQYFQTAAEIWSAYFGGRISLRMRDGLLTSLREKLDELQPSPFAAVYQAYSL